MKRQMLDKLLLIPDLNKRREALQELVFNAWKAQYYRGTFEGATGVGKSRVGILAVKQQFEKNPNSIVYVGVPTENLRDNGWPDEFRKWECSHLIPKVRFICHASMSDEIVEGEVDLFIFDECHHATILNCIFFSNNKVWCILGLSATVPSEAEKLVLINKLCPTCFQVTLEESVELESIADFEVKVLLFHLNSEDLNVIVETTTGPIVRKEEEHYLALTSTLRHAMYRTPGAKFFWMQKRTAFIKNCDTRNQIAEDVMKYIIEPNKRTLIFCGSIEQSKILCGDNIYNSKTTNEKLKAFQAKEINYLGAVNALNEGENIVELDQILVVCLDSKDRSIIQRIGRVVRWREGHKGSVIVIVAKDTADERWYKEAFKKFDTSRIKEYFVKPIKRNPNGTTITPISNKILGGEQVSVNI